MIVNMACLPHKTVLLVLVACLSVNDASVTSGIMSLFDLETSDLLEDNAGIVAAFGDFNGDQRGDIFIISNDSQKISVLLAQEDKSYKHQAIIHVDADSVITSVVPADFNGDVQMDVLVVTRSMSQDGPYYSSFYWGNGSHHLNPKPYILDEHFIDEPLILDFNADMLPDMLAERAHQPGTREVWLSQHNQTFVPVDFPKDSDDKPKPFARPQSHAFVDMNRDLVADILITTEVGYEIWLNVDGEFVHNSTRPYPTDLKYIGQSSFADLDLDERLDHIVPGCLEDDCSKSVIYVYNITSGEWMRRLDHEAFVMNDQAWNFVPPTQNLYQGDLNQSFPVVLRMGDYNLDGYADALAVLKGTQGGHSVQRIFLFDNIACAKDECTGRTFQLHESEKFADMNKGAIIGTFYDIYEDGMPDIVTVSMTTDSVSPLTGPRINLMKNYVAADDCFIKITVESALCGKECAKASNPYGVNYPGPTVNYSTTKTDGSEQRSIGTQLTQTAHFALQTPYMTFGLGPTPNFLNSLTAGIPKASKEQLRQKSFPFIIPNSQLIVIPHPPDQVTSWQLKLYVTPSQLVYVTGAALLGTCGFVAGIAGVLHWREKREDFLEKKQEAQKFHFDAM